MHIIHDLETFQPEWKSAVLTLGVFDGLHLGHQALLKRLQKRSRRGNRARVLVTYHPHPDIVLGKRKSSGGYELFTYEEKLALFQQFDLDAVVFLPFTKELARMTALRYLKEILLGKLLGTHIIIGYDQCFGRGRKGDYNFLKMMSRRYNYSVERIKAVQTKKEIISSSRIRRIIQEGKVEEGSSLLGYDFFLSGTVVRGFQRGEKIGFPTANIEVPESKIVPYQGVYAGYIEWGEKRYRAMMNIGLNPTFAGERLSIEAHILNFEKDLYGQPLRFYFRKRLRDEIKFDSIEELKKQLDADRKNTARIQLK